MPEYVEVPPERLAPEVLQSLYEDYVSRDGTDYGAQELTLAEKVARLSAQVAQRRVVILYELESEQWDLLPADDAAALLAN